MMHSVAIDGVRVDELRQWCLDNLHQGWRIDYYYALQIRGRSTVTHGSYLRMYENSIDDIRGLIPTLLTNDINELLLAKLQFRGRDNLTYKRPFDDEQWLTEETAHLERANAEFAAESKHGEKA